METPLGLRGGGPSPPEGRNNGKTTSSQRPTLVVHNLAVQLALSL